VIDDTAAIHPNRSISEFLDPGLWEKYHLSPGQDILAPPFLQTAPSDLAMHPLPSANLGENVLFWVLLTGFTVLTIIRFHHIKRLKLMSTAIISRSAALQLMRESPVYYHRSFFPLLFIYLLSIILLIQQTVDFFSPETVLNWSSVIMFLKILGIYLAFSVVKILTIWLISVIFENVETAREYIQNIILFNLFLGLLLLPILVLVIYTYQNIFLFVAGGLALIIMVLRFIRGVAIGLSDSKFSLFHLFLYLCTLEILPIAYAAKFLSKYFFI
jgi:hypothetical protein